jgi:predicted kinase
MELVLLIGIPGSGKSSYARALRKPTLSLDAIRRRLYGDASILGKSAETDRELRRALEALARQGKDAVLDATHVSQARRGRMIRLGRRLGYDHIVGIWFKTPLHECLTRNRKRKRRVPDFVLYKMQHDLERQPPTRGEGFDELVVVNP